MKIKAEKTYPPRLVVETVGRVCDLCGCRTSDDQDWPVPPHPVCSLYDVRKVEVSCEIGTHYPDSHDAEKTSFDICPECFFGKLVPALEAIGAKPTTEKKEW